MLRKIPAVSHGSRNATTKVYHLLPELRKISLIPPAHQWSWWYKKFHCHLTMSSHTQGTFPSMSYNCKNVTVHRSSTTSTHPTAADGKAKCPLLPVPLDLTMFPSGSHNLGMWLPTQAPAPPALFSMWPENIPFHVVQLQDHKQHSHNPSTNAHPQNSETVPP